MNFIDMVANLLKLKRDLERDTNHHWAAEAIEGILRGDAYEEAP